MDMTKKGNVSEILLEGTMELLKDNAFEGLELKIQQFMKNFTGKDILAELLLHLPKIEISYRAKFVNMMMKSAMPENFPTANMQLWFAIFTLIHHALVHSSLPENRIAPPDGDVAHLAEQIQSGLDPFELEVN